MRKTAVLLLVFVFLVASGLPVASAQFEGLPYDPPIVTVTSPSLNETCRVAEVPLNVTVQIRGFIYNNIERIRWLNYSLDGQAAVPLELIVPSNLSPGYYVYGNGVLTGLSDGVHNITLYGETYVGGLTGNFTETVSFTVDTSTTPAEPFMPTAVALGITISVVTLVLLLYFTKRRQ
jgi:hypothetical protein